MSGPSAPRCAFCDIVAGRAPAPVVWANGDAMVLLDRNPIAPWHLLIIPRHHAPTLWDIDEAQFLDLMSIARSLARTLSMAMHAELAAMAIEGYGVPHAHIHLVPVNGPGELDPRRQSPASEADFSNAAKAILAAINGSP